MSSANTRLLLARLGGLRTELVDLAFALDTRGSCAAADVAMTTAARLAELCEELTSPKDGADLALHSISLSEPDPLVR